MLAAKERTTMQSRMFLCCFQCCNLPDNSEVKGDETFRRSISGLNTTRIENLPNRLCRGRVLCIIASATPNCQSWAVNLLCGNSSSSDIAFHFNPRLLQHRVVRNSRLKGQWGAEEYLTTGQFNIKKSEQFTLRIYVTDSQFLVSYNNRHVCSFGFRVPLGTITHVEISGLVDFYKVEMEEFEKYPVDESDLIVIEEVARPISNSKKMVTPIRCLLPEGFHEDWQIEIYGTPKILPQTFTISLREETHTWPSCNIPLQISANFGNNILARNAFIDNKWGMEERAGGFKFLPSTYFSLWIRRSTRKFSIWINEKLQAEFSCRCSGDLVKAIHILGDVVISGIFINKNPERYF